jgi:uncharacterized protein involved in exopolysaccharide biosynthesis
MNESNEQPSGGNRQDFDSLKILSALFKYKYFIFAFVIIVTGITALYWFSQPNVFKATANLVPPKTSGSSFESMIGNISSTLRNFGLTKIGPKTDGSYSPSVILESRSVQDSIINLFDLRKVYEMEKAKQDRVRDAFREHLDITVEMDGNFTISVVDTDPKRAADIANAYVDVANYVSERIFRRESKLNRKYLENRLHSTDSVLTFLADTLQKFSRIYKIYEPEEQAQNVGKALIDLRAEIIKQEITLELMKNRYGETDPQTSMQRDVIEELKSKLNDAENLPGFSGNFSLKNATKVGLEYTRMFAEYETYTKVKAFLLPMLEEQKINAFRRTFSFIVLDKAIPPDVKDGPRRSLYLMGAFFGSFFLAIMFIALLVQYSELMSRYNEYKNRNSKAD